MDYSVNTIENYEGRNNLQTYLEQQIKEYMAECESKKAMYTTLLDHIAECKKQIYSLKAKEDVGFSMFSPIPVESAYQTQIIRLEGQLEAYEKQRDKYIKDIRFYETKMEEMEIELEEYSNNEVSMEKQQTEITIDEDIDNEKKNYEYIVHKISEIIGYLKVDVMRSSMELNRLEQYIRNLISNQ